MTFALGSQSMRAHECNFRFKGFATIGMYTAHLVILLLRGQRCSGPTYLPTYLGVILLLPALLRTYLPTYLPTYLLGG